MFRDFFQLLNFLQVAPMLGEECGIDLAEAAVRLGLAQIYNRGNLKTIPVMTVRSDDSVRITATGILAIEWCYSLTEG